MPESTATVDCSNYLGAARLVREDRDALVVALEETAPGERVVVRATLALPYPYRPTAGDQLLVIGDAASFFVIGVLRGRGSTAFEGAAVSLRAEGGELRLRGDRGVRIDAPALRVSAEALRTVAVEAVHSFGEQQRHVRERLRQELGAVDELSEGRWLIQAKHFVLKTLKNARIKSTTVRVG